MASKQSTQSSPLITMTKAEYEAKSPDSRGIWTTERTDLKNWQEIRENYIGKRTMLSLEDGVTCLLIEDMHFVIVD